MRRFESQFYVYRQFNLVSTHRFESNICDESTDRREIQACLDLSNSSGISILNANREALSRFDQFWVLDLCNIELGQCIGCSVLLALVDDLDDSRRLINAKVQVDISSKNAPTFDSCYLTSKQIKVIWKLNRNNASFFHRRRHLEGYFEQRKLLNGRILCLELAVLHFNLL